MTSRRPIVNVAGVRQEMPTGDTVPVANGGTEIASYTVGDLIYASGTTSLAKLSDVATGNVLLSGGVGAAPSYGKVTSSHLSSMTSAQFAGVISDETGSGKLVFATLPTFTDGVTVSSPDLTEMILSATGSGGFNYIALSVYSNAALKASFTYDETATSFTIATSGSTTLRISSPVLTTPTLGVASATSLACPTFTTASGSMTFTPASGSGLNIALSTTGNFSVNSSQFCVDTGTARSGFGTASPAYGVEIKGSDVATDGLLVSTTTYTNIPNLGSVTNAALLTPRGFSLVTDSVTLTATNEFGIGLCVSRTSPPLVVANKASGARAIYIETGHIQMQSSVFQDTTTYSSTYRGTFIGANYGANYYTQKNASYSSWGIDLGGIDTSSYSGTGDTFAIIRQGAGAAHTARTRPFVINASGYVGLAGITSPTAAAHLPASTTARSSLCIPSGTAPTIPVTGDMWFDGTNLKFRIASVTKTITWT